MGHARVGSPPWTVYAEPRTTPTALALLSEPPAGRPAPFGPRRRRRTSWTVPPRLCPLTSQARPGARRRPRTDAATRQTSLTSSAASLAVFGWACPRGKPPRAHPNGRLRRPKAEGPEKVRRGRFAAPTPFWVAPPNPPTGIGEATLDHCACDQPQWNSPRAALRPPARRAATAASIWPRRSRLCARAK